MRRSGVGRAEGAARGSCGGCGGCGDCDGGSENEWVRSFSSFHCCRRAGETKPSFLLSQRGLMRGGGMAAIVAMSDAEHDGDEACDDEVGDWDSQCPAARLERGQGSIFVPKRLCFPRIPELHYIIVCHVIVSTSR